jgi:ATP-binding cassette subfamily B protein
LAIVGANGAGKTTLIKLLMRFYDPTDGVILIDGHNLQDIDITSYYHLVGALFQDFNTYGYYTVQDNIGFGQIEQIDNQARLERAAKCSGADSFINQFPNKYQQILSTSIEDGISISGGQWQRIALARALFRDAAVLVLDEPTSAIDAHGEYEIFQEIAKHKEGKTSIIISHRFSTVRKADRIVVIEQGKIIEQGTHEQLIAVQGIYHRLFSLQAKDYQ